MKYVKNQLYEGVVVKSTKVLIVHDNKINQKILKKMLANMSIESDIAVNGFEAVKVFGENEYTLVLMDLMMPLYEWL